jgi:hypothetical protein
MESWTPLLTDSVGSHRIARNRLVYSVLSLELELWNMLPSMPIIGLIIFEITDTHINFSQKMRAQVSILSKRTYEPQTNVYRGSKNSSDILTMTENKNI